MAKKIKPIKIPFLTETKQALKELHELEEGIKDIDEVADGSRAAFDKMSKESGDAASEMKQHYKSLRLVSAETFQAEVAAAKEAYAKISEVHGKGSKESIRAYEALQRKVVRANKLMATNTRQTFGQALDGVGKKMKSVGSAITARATAAATAAAASGALLIGNTTQNILEVEKAAKVAGLSIERMQEIGFAAGTLGFEMEDVGDKFKDLREKISELTELDSGTAKDFFENIAKKAGITLDEFRKLDGIDQFQQVVNALEASGKTLEDGATIYLEDLFSDSTKLFALFENNGALLKKLTKDFYDAGGGFDENDIKNAQAMNVEMAKFATTMNQLGASLIDSGVVDGVSAAASSMSSFIKWLTETIGEATVKIGAIVAAVAAVLGPIIWVFGQIFSVIGKIIGPLKTAVLWVGKFAARWKLVGIAIAAIKTAFGAVITFFGGSVAIAVGAIAGIIAAITALGLTIYHFWDEIVAFISASIQVLGDILYKAFVEPFVRVFQAAKKFGAWVKKLWNGGDTDSGPGNMPGYRSGGYTGNGGLNQIAGFIHGREYVLNAAATAFYGRDLLDSMNSRAFAPQMNMIAPAVAASPSAGSRVALDLNIGGNSYGVETDASTADQLTRDMNRKKAAQYGRKPRNMR